jgi:hypothetical protein
VGAKDEAQVGCLQILVSVRLLNATSESEYVTYQTLFRALTELKKIIPNDGKMGHKSKIFIFLINFISSKIFLLERTIWKELLQL